MGNPKDSIKKLLKLVYEFSKVTGYKTNIQKSVPFQYTSNGAAEREMKESIPFTVAPKILRYLGIILTKEMKVLYSENHKILMKENEDDTTKWKDIPCS